jgi:hypothetical protein
VVAFLSFASFWFCFLSFDVSEVGWGTQNTGDGDSLTLFAGPLTVDSGTGNFIPL